MEFLKALGIGEYNSGAALGVSFKSNNKSALIESFNPNNGEPIASVYAASAEDYETLMQGAEQAFEQWRTTPAPKRGDIIRQIGNALREHKDALGSLVSMEMGKSKQEGDGEVQEMIDIADFAVGQSRMLYGKTMHSERDEHRMYEQWHPYGVVGVISAFNFPVAVWAWNAFIAAICGNVTVWKPSHKTPLCAVAVQAICDKVLKANQCPDIFGFFIPESHELAEQFVKDTRIPLLSFTGSTKAGRHVARIVAERLGNTILELGGNNAMIIDDTADLDIAIPAVVFGAVGTCGQRCTSTRRVFIQDTIFDEVIKRLKRAYAQITIGDALDANNLMGPLIDSDAVTSYENALSRIKKLGGTIAFGGNVIKGPGFFIEPTLVTDCDNSWDIIQEETFAPIVYLMQYKTLDEAIALQNNVSQGLSSALFTLNLRHAEQFLSAHGSDCGIANINIGTSGAEIGGAFGGEKDTGGGRESGSDAWKAYMRRQTNTINWSNALPLAQGIQFDLA